MENKNLFSGKIGDHATVSVDWVSGQLVAGISLSSSLLSGSVSATIKTKEDLEALKALIPGTLDDAVIGIVEAALGL